MRIDEIINRLTTLRIDHEVILNDRLDTDIDFVPASLKRLIRNGLYFIQSLENFHAELPADSVIITNEMAAGTSHIIRVNNPQLTHYKLLQTYNSMATKGIHPTAIISDDALLGNNVSIGPFCVIGKCKIGDDVCLKNHVVIEDNVTIGAGTFIDSNSVIGAGGLAWIWDDDGSRIMQPQLGGVIIEKDCLLATDVTVVRGSLSENTWIGEGTVIAHGTKIGHGSQIGANVHMANNVSLAGNAVIGASSFLGSACVISSNISLPPNTIVGASAMVNKNFEDEFLTLAGVPAIVIRKNNFNDKPKGVPKPFKHKTL